MIPGTVHTNVDKLKRKQWPKSFSDNIQVGHYVQAGDGATAKIVRITHATRGDSDSTPIILIEVWTDPMKL